MKMISKYILIMGFLCFFFVIEGGLNAAELDVNGNCVNTATRFVKIPGPQACGLFGCVKNADGTYSQKHHASVCQSNASERQAIQDSSAGYKKAIGSPSMNASTKTCTIIVKNFDNSFDTRACDMNGDGSCPSADDCASNPASNRSSEPVSGSLDQGASSGVEDSQAIAPGECAGGCYDP